MNVDFLLNIIIFQHALFNIKLIRLTFDFWIIFLQFYHFDLKSNIYEYF